MIREVISEAKTPRRMKPSDFKNRIKLAVGDKVFNKISSDSWDKLFKSIPLNGNSLKGVTADIKKNGDVTKFSENPKDYED